MVLIILARAPRHVHRRDVSGDVGAWESGRVAASAHNHLYFIDVAGKIHRNGVAFHKCAVNFQ